MTMVRSVWSLTRERNAGSRIDPALPWLAVFIPPWHEAQLLV
jgi:hypothetical protein